MTTAPQGEATEAERALIREIDFTHENDEILTLVRAHVAAELAKAMQPKTDPSFFEFRQSALDESNRVAEALSGEPEIAELKRENAELRDQITHLRDRIANARVCLATP